MVVVEDVVGADWSIERVVVGFDIHQLVHMPQGIGFYVKDDIIVLLAAAVVVPHAAEHIKPLVAVVPICA